MRKTGRSGRTARGLGKAGSDALALTTKHARTDLKWYDEPRVRSE